MERKDKASIFAVVSTSICAIIWNILLFVDLYYGYSNNVSFVLHIVCAIVWDICAIVWIRSVYKELHADHETGTADNK